MLSRAERVDMGRRGLVEHPRVHQQGPGSDGLEGVEQVGERAVLGQQCARPGSGRAVQQVGVRVPGEEDDVDVGEAGGDAAVAWIPSYCEPGNS